MIHTVTPRSYRADITTACYYVFCFLIATVIFITVVGAVAALVVTLTSRHCLLLSSLLVAVVGYCHGALFSIDVVIYFSILTKQRHVRRSRRQILLQQLQQDEKRDEYCQTCDQRESVLR